MWLSLALASAFLLAVRRIYEKNLSAQFGNFSLAFALQIFSLPVVFVFLFFFPVPKDVWHLPLQFWGPLVIIWTVLVPVQTYFLYRSLREGELSEVTPVSALLPVLNIGTSLFLIGEAPTIYGLAGIVLTVYATFLLLTDTPRGSHFSYNRPVLFMIISITCTAIGSTLDKVATEVSTPVFYSFVNMCGSAIVFLVLTYAYQQQSELKQMRSLFGTLSVMGVVLALGFVAFIEAFTLAPTSYVLALRSGGFLVAALWGIVFFRESLSNKKVIALVLFTLGTFGLALG